jgi:hypothetical protein
VRVLVTSTFIALVLVASVGAAPDVVNPSFETPEAPDGSYIAVAGGQQFSGWQVTGSGVAIVDDSFVSAGFQFPAAAGDQWLDLTGETTGGNGGVTQSLSLATGRSYTLAFSVGNVSGGDFGVESTVQLLIDGEPVRTATNSRPGTTLSWQQFTHEFTAANSPTVIEFRNTDPAGDHNNGIDRLRVVEAIGPPQPTLGETAAARTVKGTVLVGIPSGGARAAQKGVEFVPLEEAREIPIGAFVDTTNGTVAITTAKNRRGKTQTGQFAAGLFQVLQSRKLAAKGLTELRMKGGTAKFKRCGSGGDANAALSRRALRRLRARARGRFRTRSRYSAATVRGTSWTVTDRCDGTLTQVKRGKVAVRDFRRKKTIVVAAGKSYLAAAPDG